MKKEEYKENHAAFAAGFSLRPASAESFRRVRRRLLVDGAFGRRDVHKLRYPIQTDRPVIIGVDADVVDPQIQIVALRRMTV